MFNGDTRNLYLGATFGPIPRADTGNLNVNLMLGTTYTQNLYCKKLNLYDTHNRQ